METTKIISFLIILLFSTKCLSQEVYLERKEGVKQITTYLITIGDTLIDENKPVRVDFYDEEGRIAKREKEQTITVYSYDNLGEVSINTTRKKNNEFVRSEKYSVSTTDSLIIIRELDFTVWAMAGNMCSYDEGINHTEKFSFVSAYEKCENCIHKSENRYVRDEKNNIILKISYSLAQYGLVREDITTYEWYSEDLCIERKYELKRNKLGLAYLKVKDKYGSRLFFKKRCNEAIDHFDNEGLKEYKLPTYKYNDKGDWVERILEEERYKTIRIITYY